MPVYNERPTVGLAIARVLAQPVVREVIVVDDASNDGSWEAAQRCAAGDPRVRVFRLSRNQGKGAALREGFARATAPFLLIQDADLEYDPQEYGRLLQPLLTGMADAVFGSRFLGGGAHRVLYFWHAVGNRLLTLLSNMFTNLNLTDVETCYKVFRRELLDRMRLEECRFGFELELTARLSQLGARLYEVPISYHGRTYAEGKKANWRDGVSALRCVLKYNVFRRL
ncbi:MAG: glycosyltransferase family 2 protein [Verrucomicrobiales bacterium]|nr:glycosyltransferase family 2 protein [Verrucomicrobiales bacterium]